MRKVKKNKEKKVLSFFRKLVENNTGVSSKNFFLVCVTIIGCFTILVFDVAVLIEVIRTNTISTDLVGMAACFTAISSGFIGAGFAKVKGDKNEYEAHRNNEYTSDSDEEDVAC